MPSIPVPSVADVLDRLHKKLEDIPALAERYKQHRFAEYYDLLVEETVSELLDVPVDRTCLGLDPLEDDEDLQYNVGQLADLIAQLFDKDPAVVEDDIVATIASDVNQDLRVARLNRHFNLLH